MRPSKVSWPGSVGVKTDPQSKFWRFMVLAAALAVLGSVTAWAGGPRFVSGPGVDVSPGQNEVWATSQLLYFTDPGDLGPGVTHAQADAMVAAAAAVWNVPTSSLALAQGGQLAEHVSGADTYLGSSGVVFPADVQTANETAIPVAVLYDTDGSLIDLLLGEGASDPLSCLQNGVIESVDDIQADGNLHHALVILNGRCVGSEPQQMTQMQYQLARAFGRVLGLAWSQANDNVFTAATTVTANQEAYWPLMHPLDVLCGPYSYQCMPNPFTLRPDDLNSLLTLYPVDQGNQTQGKQLSSTQGLVAWGWIDFLSGQGMDWVNITVHRVHAGVLEDWEVAAATTGVSYQQAIANPVSGPAASASGTPDGIHEGLYNFEAIPYDGLSNLYFTTEPINPLYTGEYALAPYVRPPATPSGSPQVLVDYSAFGLPFGNNTTVAPDAAPACAPGNDGIEGAPVAMDPSGSVQGQLCGWGHNSWWTATVRAGHSWTLEATATDETGAPSLNKAQPVLGVWGGADPAGTLPTVAAQAVPFNAMVTATTQLQVPGAATDTPLRLMVGDQFGAGRPDFTYRLRMLYADAVSPTVVGQGGGLITLLGTGFAPGNQVLLNGVPIQVQSLTPTRIVALAPAPGQVGASLGSALEVAVLDPETGASTDMPAALRYTSQNNLLVQVSAPANVESGTPAAIPFALQVLASDGLTPVPNAIVNLASTSSTALLDICGTAPSCWVATDGSGMVRSTVTGVAVGPVLLTATVISSGAMVQAELSDTAPVRGVSFASRTAYVAAGGVGGSWTLQLNALQDGLSAVGVPVRWSTASGVALSSASPVTGSDGSATVTVSVGNLPPGSETVTGCLWTGVCATWVLQSVDATQWVLTVAAGAGQSVSEAQVLEPLRLTVTDSLGHALPGALLQVYQRALGWQGLCSVQGACPATPVLAVSQGLPASDAQGMVSVDPLQVRGLPQTVEIALTWGSQGFLACNLVVTPGP